MFFLKELEPIFTRLTDQSLLSRCLMGLNWNQNESINAILWKHCLKTWFCWKRHIEIDIFNTISKFYSGATTKATVYERLGVQPGTNFYKATAEKDKIHIKNAAKKISYKYRLNRNKYNVAMDPWY